MSQNTMQVMHARDMQKTSGRQKILKILGQLGIYLFLIVMAAIVLFPFYWMIISSLKTSDELMRAVPTLWPDKFVWENYPNVLNKAQMDEVFEGFKSYGQPASGKTGY